jgi:hypothetical protein
MLPDHPFDDISRVVASTISRRQMVVVLARTMGAAAIAGLWPKRAYADTDAIFPGVGKLCPENTNVCAVVTDIFTNSKYACCPAGFTCCPSAMYDATRCCSDAAGERCFQNDHCCLDKIGTCSSDKNCCPDGPVPSCVDLHCCPAGSGVFINGHCCPPGTGDFRQGRCCPSAQVCGDTTCCDDTHVCTGINPQSLVCCPKEKACTVSGILICCLGQQVCVMNRCCPVGTTLVCNNNDCCLPGQVCKKIAPFDCCTPKAQGQLSALRSGPPVQVDLAVQDFGPGLASISVLTAVNCELSGPAFDLGTLDPVICTATKLDQTQPAQFTLEVCDVNGCCTSADPVLTTLKLNVGRQVKQTFDSIPRHENQLTVQNANPGLDELHLEINGKRHKPLQLADMETKVVDLTAFMQREANTVTLIGRGDPGSSAVITIADVAAQIAVDPAQTVGHAQSVDQAQPADVAKAVDHHQSLNQTQSLDPTLSKESRKENRRFGLSPAAKHSKHYDRLPWGHLMEYIEESTDAAIATTSAQAVELSFAGLLDGRVANDKSRYSVEVNGTQVRIDSVAYSPGNGVVRFLLPIGTLSTGDEVDVFWDEMLDVRGRKISGHIGPIIARPIRIQ